MRISGTTRSRHDHYALARLAVVALGFVFAACNEVATLPVAAGSGPNPVLPEPVRTLIPTVNVAAAKAWSGCAMPQAAGGLSVSAFARDLDHPRWLYVLPNGDVLVAETAAPPQPEDGTGLKGWVTRRIMKRAGSVTPSANRISVLSGADGAGAATRHSVLIEHLQSPFGMALVGDTLYVADTDAVLAFHYTSGMTKITEAGVRLTDLPAGPINHHWTKNLIASADGSKLYVTVGSNSNIAEHGMAEEAERAAVWEVDTASGAHRLFASGLRNPNGLAWEPTGGALWVAVNERDELGSDLVPDYMTALRDGGFYGWPYRYYGTHVDDRAPRAPPGLLATTLVPDYALGPHTASLGLAWSGGSTLPLAASGGMFVGQHGSWNRRPRSGYRVVFVPFSNGVPAGAPVDVLTGFLDASGQARGRPVGVAVARDGALLVADDVGNVIWRVSKQP